MKRLLTMIGALWATTATGAIAATLGPVKNVRDIDTVSPDDDAEHGVTQAAAYESENQAQDSASGSEIAREHDAQDDVPGTPEIIADTVAEVKERSDKKVKLTKDKETSDAPEVVPEPNSGRRFDALGRDNLTNARSDLDIFNTRDPLATTNLPKMTYANMEIQGPAMMRFGPAVSMVAPMPIAQVVAPQFAPEVVAQAMFGDVFQDTSLTAVSATSPAETSTTSVPVTISEPTPEPAPEPVVVAEPAVEPVADSEPAPESDPDVISGRVTKIAPSGSDIVSISVESPPDHGNLTVGPDNTLSLVLTQSDYVGPMSITYSVTRSNGVTETVTQDLEVLPGSVESGWGLGTHYMLETDDTGSLVVEHGDNHRDVYVSGHEDALTVADIAALEDIPLEDVHGWFLRDNPEYGSSPDIALAEDAAQMLWGVLMRDSANEPASHWLRLESGYSYDMGRTVYAGMQGEDELHPIHYTSYGEGAKPILEKGFELIAEGGTNIVFSDIQFGYGGSFISGENILLEDVTSTGHHLLVQNIDNFTLRNSEVFDVAREDPLNGEEWVAHTNRVSGIYSSNTDGLLIENTLFDRNGWAEGYSTDITQGELPQAPSIFNHNIYFAVSTRDVTVRDTISLQGASFGAQFRGGAFVEDNAFIDNNSAVYVAGGSDGNGNYNGNYSLYSGNIITSGGYKEYGGPNGHLSGGLADYAPLTAIVDNIVAHMANPNDPDEQAAKSGAQGGFLGGADAVYNNTIVYNWVGNSEAGGDLNVPNIDPALLDQVTIQNFAATLLNDENATIRDLGDYLRIRGAEAFDGVSDAQLIVNFFQEGFGLNADLRVDAMTATFIPSGLAAGVRWDNRLNWSTEDLPGSVKGDSVDLADNWVLFGGNGEIKNLDFGARGRLTVDNGRLDVTGEVFSDGNGAELIVQSSGQIWIQDYRDTDLLTMDVSSGRLAFTGTVDGFLDLDASGGQILLTETAQFDLTDGSRFNIIGTDATVGFDGVSGETSILRLEEGSTLSFTASADGLGQISEFRSGVYGDQARDVASGINFNSGTLELDLSDLTDDAGEYDLISVDEIVGSFRDVHITGLGSDRDAQLVFDYEDDVVSLLVTAEGQGSGEVDVSLLEEATPASGVDTLLQALTSGLPNVNDELYPEVVSVGGNGVLEFL